MVEKIIGRYLMLYEEVHHIGIKYLVGSIQNKQDNRSKNLIAFANGKAHRRFQKGFNIEAKDIIFDRRKGDSLWKKAKKSRSRKNFKEQL